MDAEGADSDEIETNLDMAAPGRKYRGVSIACAAAMHVRFPRNATAAKRAVPNKDFLIVMGLENKVHPSDYNSIIFIPLFTALFFIFSSVLNVGAHEMSHHGMTGMYGPYPVSREASGTAWVPESSPHEGVHVMAGPWMLMLHGYVNQVYDHQGGPRGDDKSFSESMVMVMGQRRFVGGTLGLRGMFSLDPAMGKNGYPLLFQTGETANNRTPLIDRQHPHDLFMELAVSYSIPIGDVSSVFAYAGLPGEPALGPATFMHRFSGLDNPEAPITHHWLDSTHITYGVMTTGYIYKGLKAEVSGFRGREPDENRWNIESPRIDSYSYRITLNPARDWSGQVSYGKLRSPEQLEPNIDTKRMTASIAYNKSFNQNNWQTTAAWGQNKNEGPGIDHRLDAYLVESALVMRHAHTFFGRVEGVQKDELFDATDPRAGTVYRVGRASLGYIYDFAPLSMGQVGIGGLGSAYVVPSAVQDAYGKHPMSYMIFLRAKLGTSLHHE